MDVKTFVIDTNVLLFDPHSIFRFGQNNVFIPLVVVEELDRFKRDQSENGRNAREFARVVDQLRQRGSLANGLSLDSGGKLIISAGPKMSVKMEALVDLSKNDNIILGAAFALKEAGEKVTVVTKDINMRLKSDAVGLDAKDYGASNIQEAESLYSGQGELSLGPQRLNTFESERFLSLSDDEIRSVNPHQYMTLTEHHNPHRRLYGRYCPRKKGIVPLIKWREGVWGIHAKNIEQQFAFDALVNNEVKLVSLVGKAGTGKTLLAIASGLEMTINKNDYARVLVSRPVQPMGRDIGYLPGDVNEKLGPWMQPIFDNIDFLFGNQRIGQEGSWEELINQGLLHVEPLTYIRGRSIPSQYLIVDEAQNLTPHEIKTIITRAGEGTKIVLTGDPEQIDSPYLDSVNNGLTYCVERLKGESLVSHTILRIGERSELSEIAAKML